MGNTCTTSVKKLVSFQETGKIGFRWKAAWLGKTYKLVKPHFIDLVIAGCGMGMQLVPKLVSVTGLGWGYMQDYVESRT